MSEQILYIEDEEDYQLLVRRILSRANLEVVIAGDGREGLAMLRRARPRMLLLDINLPDTDGYKICQALRQDPAYVDLPILMLTVRRRPEEWLQGFSVGANDYLSKPLDPVELVERIQICISGKAQQFTSAGTPEFHLIQAAIAGNRAAFEVLIAKYKERLVEAIRQIGRPDAEADDAVSHAFLSAFENLKSFRGESSFYTWLYRIAVNEATAAHRKLPKISIDEITRGDEPIMPAALTESNSFEERVSDVHERELLSSALREIPAIYRQALELYFLKDFTYEKIAEKLDIPLGTVMSRMHKARTLLKEAWEQRAGLAPR
jgi:RNA polymerase sigma-70 factor, ECF subfamily